MSSTPCGWLAALVEALGREPAIVRIVLAEVQGSTPREAGTSMLVWPSGVSGTIGGGRLEWDAIAAARELLRASDSCGRVMRVVLGTDVGQCCGGVVSLWLERYGSAELGALQAAHAAAAQGPTLLLSTLGVERAQHRLICDPVVASDSHVPRPRTPHLPRLARNARGEPTLLERLDEALPAVWLYGAGHVGQALARILAELPVQLTWIDSRAEWLPAAGTARLCVRRCADPSASLEDAPVGAHFIVMTHSHSLDYDLCRGLLERNDFLWLGLIGSMSKAARFRSRLAREGIAAQAIARLVCPIGIEGIASKWPTAIAVAIAAQLLQQISTRAVQGAPAPEDCSRDCASCGSTLEQPELSVLAP